jgi:membrane protein DedA with SNARE-associated domain
MGWFAWAIVGALAWVAVALLVAVALGRAIREPPRPRYRNRATR